MAADAVPNPMSPTAGPEDPSVRLADVMGSTTTNIQAPLEDLSGATAAAVSAGEAWCAGAADWVASAQGAGSGGFALGDDGATGEWDSDMPFSHQGP
jgi:hypothetical protein